MRALRQPAAAYREVARELVPEPGVGVDGHLGQRNPPGLLPAVGLEFE